MKITKIVETRVNINDIQDMFCSDYNANILRILKLKYTKVCFKSIYILDVIRIVTRSSLHCKNKVLDGSTYIDVSFEVVGLIYEKGEIIHNCKVIQINNNGTMHAKSEYASIHIKNVEGLVVVKENDVIPIIVHMVRCAIYDEEISVMAVPFMPIIMPNIIYKLTESEKASDLSLFDFKELVQLEKSIENIKKNNKSVYKFFIDLIYPFKTIKKNTYKKIEISEKTLYDLKIGTYVYNPESLLDDNTLCILDVADTLKIDASVVSIDKNDYILFAANAYLKQLMSLLEFLQLYDTPVKIKEKAQIWSLYKLLKK